jgi:fucose 4-O-acetylase-like acetyltransferase
MWFLPALFIWRLTSPLWRTIRRPLPVALVIAVLASFSPRIGNDLDLQRVLQFLPYFVLGLRLRPEYLRKLRCRTARLLSLPVVAVAGVVAYWTAPHMPHPWLYHSDSAQELGAPWWAGPMMTFVLLGCSLALTACFFAWVPRRRHWWTALGTGTMYGYLLHGFVIKGALYRGWYDHPWVHGPLGEATVTLCAGAAVTLLCSPPVRRIFRFAVEPRLAWAFRKEPASA